MSARVDYDSIAPLYETRYERNDYAGVQQALGAFIRKESRLDRQHVLEVGCGTGHWVQVLLAADVNVVGLDLSGGMLNAARTRVPDAPLIRARAEALPCQTESCDRIYSVNALHHFTDPRAFLCEARRVLRPGGGLLTIGLDPHTGQDRWWIYEYFPTALVEDRRRYLPAARIRELMAASGFSRCETRVVQHLPVKMTVSEAARRGFLDRTSTSQLMVISQAEYETGMKQIHSADAGRAEEKLLSADLRLYGTIGWVA